LVLVDSSIWIESARRDGDMLCKVALEELLAHAEATFCSPVRLEVLGGARTVERRRMSAYFAIVPYVALAERHWSRAMELGWKLRDAGHTLPWSDVLIAAVALDAGCRVYAKDKHFDTMAEVLGLHLYRPGYGGSFDPGTE
jgi:predicted nucleic acid-binding protein